MIIGIIVGIIALIVLVFVISGIKIVPQTNVYVIERMGSFKRILTNGINFIIPLIDKVVLKETIKERVLDFPAQDVITKDNVTMKIDTVVYMQITDPKLFAYGVEKPLFAVENMTATTLRNLIGDLELDQTLTSRDSVNEKLRLILDGATDPWGIKVLRVELKNILPPEDIRKAMEKQMRAEREKRQQILVAEGTRASDILVAEGQKASNILKAEGTMEAINLINSSNPSREALILKSYEALMEVSKGEATTILLPTDLTDTAALAATFGAVSSKTKKTASKTPKARPTTAGRSKSLQNLIDEVKKDITTK
ncbi:SPFH domain-containing protein [Candidatus Mycoplasma mahonii]|uniref:SPFH domain-containing protein n=1 Tax=Candidatus Mycoplasma mahonii TaxID=3004105 RepID=UPI0026EB2483|nr:SPFH domain-containing protein [Candidatus Mycoplasma mahonii]WKX02229.1 SPFH/Band 7/PHB domain protein [Candidatus Mycoplasma mahonii]